MIELVQKEGRQVHAMAQLSGDIAPPTQNDKNTQGPVQSTAADIISSFFGPTRYEREHADIGSSALTLVHTQQAVGALYVRVNIHCGGRSNGV